MPPQRTEMHNNLIDEYNISDTRKAEDRTRMTLNSMLYKLLLGDVPIKLAFLVARIVQYKKPMLRTEIVFYE